jgi:type III secretory pathway component EscU
MRLQSVIEVLVSKLKVYSLPVILTYISDNLKYILTLGKIGISSRKILLSG